MRYFILYLHFIRFSFNKALIFRFDFFFRIFMDVLWYITQIAFFSVIFRYTSLLGGWNYNQVIIFMGSIFFIDALHMTIFSNNIWWLPVYINKGELDYYLIRPISSLFFLTLRDFAANSFMNLILSFSFLIWSIYNYEQTIELQNLFVYSILLVSGFLIFSILSILFTIPVFWTHSGKGFKDIFSSLQRFGNQPHQIYTGFVKKLLLSVLPFSLIASVPVSVLFDGWTIKIVGCYIVCLFFLITILLIVWKLGLKTYSSASS